MVRSRATSSLKDSPNGLERGTPTKAACSRRNSYGRGSTGTLPLPASLQVDRLLRSRERRVGPRPTRAMSPSIDQRQDREFASELKFVVSRRLAERIRVWARARLAPDPNAAADVSNGYPVTSLYFDTQHFDVFHRKGSFARSKYRIRCYGPSEAVFLDGKLKTRGLVSKRRSIVPMNDLERLADAEPDRGWTGHWYQQRLLARQLRPVCRISYRRAARVSMTGYGPIR